MKNKMLTTFVLCLCMHAASQAKPIKSNGLEVGDIYTYLDEKADSPDTYIYNNTITKISSHEIWIESDYYPHKSFIAIYESSTGELKKVLLDGIEQELGSTPAPLSSRKERINVPAGTFNCIHNIYEWRVGFGQLETWFTDESDPIKMLVKTTRTYPLTGLPSPPWLITTLQKISNKRD